MPLERRPISVSQLSELLGVDPARFVAIERRCGRGEIGQGSGWFVVVEGEDMQTTQTFPEVSDNKVRKPKKGRKR